MTMMMTIPAGMPSVAGPAPTTPTTAESPVAVPKANSSRPGRNSLGLDALVDDGDQVHLFPIDFAFNYMPPRAMTYLHAPPICFQFPLDKEFLRQNRKHGIALHPYNTGLPWFSGLRNLRQNKHWKLNLESTSELLRLFADDVTLNSPCNVNGHALAEFARRELETNAFDRYSRFTTYMFPEADESRVGLLAQIILFIVIFDGESDGIPFLRDMFTDVFFLFLG